MKTILVILDRIQVKLLLDLVKQQKPINIITVNIIIRFMRSLCPSPKSLLLNYEWKKPINQNSVIDITLKNHGINSPIYRHFHD
jgi:hypothetical protein